ncbi:membrane protein [Vreelandella hamiltonii]|nr:membrane protein [Halomonas hamiltonii]KHJ52232.1 membrane protein [Halomonas hydrothermalis]
MAQQLAFALGLAAIHLFAGRLQRLNALPRSAWLSFAGGVSVGYVFIHIFPALSDAHDTITEHGPLFILEHNAYLTALVGLGVFYGLEQLAKVYSHRDTPQKRVSLGKLRGVFWIHIGSFALYNLLIGYLLVYRDNQLPEALFFFLAMGFHFLVNDHGLVQHHRQRYLMKGRWVLAAAVFVGWLIGHAIQLTDALISLLYAFVAGGLVLNVLKEELPEDRHSRFLPFAGGAAVCAGLLMFA